MLETSIKTDKLVEELNNRGYICINEKSFTDDDDLMMFILIHFKGSFNIRYNSTEVRNTSNYEVHRIIHSAELVIYKHKDENIDLHQRNIDILKLCSKFRQLHIVGGSSDRLSSIFMEDDIWLKLMY